jgi:hypothetical protein
MAKRAAPTIPPQRGGESGWFHLEIKALSN